MKTNFEIRVACRICEKLNSIFCNKQDYEKFKNGTGYIQDILHYLSADQRELLISQTCGECFDKMFSSEEENDE